MAAFGVFVVLLMLENVASLDNGLGLLPPIGWNTWCTLGPCGRDYCDENEVMAMGDAIVSSGLKDIGFLYVNLDDCWASYRDEEGFLHADELRFPSGMQYVADYLHSIGLKYGLYTDAGNQTCSQGERTYRIPGSLGYYAQDAQTFAGWGMDYVKMDWCYTSSPVQLYPEVQYPEMSAALNATGRPMYFETCEAGIDQPWNWMRRYANSWRSTYDHHDEWENTAGIIEIAASIGQHGVVGGWNYLDFLMTGGEGCPSLIPGQRCPGMTDTEYITEFTIWVMAASPLIVATELRNMSSIQQQILFNTEMFAVHQDKLGRAGGRIGTWSCESNVTSPPPCQIWARPLFNGDMFIVLYNSDAISHSITFDFSLIGWDIDEVSIRDLWAHQELGTFNASYASPEISSHGVMALRISLP